MDLFTAGYTIGWIGVAEDLIEAPTWLWVPTYALGCLICLVVILPGLYRLAMDIARYYR